MIDKLKYQFSIDNYSNVIKRANELLKQEEYKSDYTILMYRAISFSNLYEDEKAIASYEEIIQNYPDKIEPKINIALILINVGEFVKAREHLIEAKVLQVDNLDVINNLIFIEEQLHNFQKVIELANEAIDIDNIDPSTWITRGAAYERIGQYDDAVTDGLKAISLSANDEIYLQMAYNCLGYTYSKMEDLTNAEFYLRKAIEIDEEEPFQFNNIGLVFAKQGEIDKGLKFVNHSIKLDSRNSYAYKNRAKIYIMQGENKLAKNDLLKAKRLDYEIDYDNEVNELLESL